MGSTAIRNTGITNPGNVSFGCGTYQPDNYSLYNNYTGDPLVSAEIKLNGHNRFSSQTAKYFSFVQSYESGMCTPSVGVYMYSFALNPNEHQPSGTCNFSKLDTTSLDIILNDSIGESTISIFAVNYNILRIMGGLANIAYVNN